MNSRKRVSHEKIINYLQKLSDVVANPDESKVKTLSTTAQLLKIDFNNIKFSSVKYVPNVDDRMLQKMVDILSFDLTKLLIESDNPKMYLNDINGFEHPYEAIKELMSCDMTKIENESPDRVKMWQKIANTDIQKKFDIVIKALSVENGKSTIRIVRNIARYVGAAILIIGVLLMNYIVCCVAIGLFCTDAILGHMMKEAADPNSDTILDVKNYPYVLSGSFPMLHVDRSSEYNEICSKDIESYSANNLAAILKAAYRYLDDLKIEGNFPVDRSAIRHDIKFPFEDISAIVNHLQPMNEVLLYSMKNKIIEISKKIINHSFKLDTAHQEVFCERFIDNISYYCRSMSDLRDADRQLLDIGSLTQMFEILCLQIWDKFLKANLDIKELNLTNEYLKVDVDNTREIIQMYNMLPDMPYKVATTRSNDIMSKIAESITDDPHMAAKLMVEAPDMKNDQKFQNITTNFGNAIQTAKEGASQLSSKALPWCQQNKQLIVGLAPYFANEDSVQIKPYSYNIANVRSSLNLLTAIDAYLKSGYLNDRSKGNVANINALVNTAFPTLKLDETKAAVQPAVVMSIIATGNVNGVDKEETITGAKLRNAYSQMVNFLTDRQLTGYFTSGIFDKLKTSVDGFKNATTGANKTPMKESIEDDILSLMEADGISAPTPPTMGDAGAKQNTAPQNPQQPDPKKPVVTNAKQNNDIMVLDHATRIAVAVMSIIQSMASDAYTVISAYYPSLTNRKSGTQQNSQ